MEICMDEHTEEMVIDTEDDRDIEFLEYLKSSFRNKVPYNIRGHTCIVHEVSISCEGPRYLTARITGKPVEQ